MSFGFSIGDIAALVALTKKTYDGWRDAPKEFADVVQALRESNRLLCHVERRFDALTGAENDATKQKEIGDLLSGCQKTISELRVVVKRRRRLGHWDRIRLGAGASHVNDCKNRLARHITILTPFLFSLELESMGKSISSLPATLNCLPQMLSNALPTALGKMIDERIEDSRTARGSVMTTYGDDDDTQAYRELRRNLRHFGIKDSVVREHSTELFNFIRTLTHDNHDKLLDDAEGAHQVLEERTAPKTPTLVSRVVQAAEDTKTVCANNASTAYRQYQAYVETEDEDESVESVVAVPSNDNTTTRPGKAERYMGDSGHRSGTGDSIGDGANDRSEAANRAGITPCRRESTTGASRRRNNQAYVETENEDDTMETTRTAPVDCSLPTVRSGSSQETPQKCSFPSDLDHDMPRTKPRVESSSEHKARGPVWRKGFSSAFGQSNGETKPNRTSGKTDRPLTTPSKPKQSSTFPMCSDPDCQCNGCLELPEPDGTDSVATHASCDGYCSSYLQSGSESGESLWEHLRGGDRHWSAYAQRSEADDCASEIAHSGHTDEDEERSDERDHQKPSPRQRDKSTNRTRQGGNLDTPSSVPVAPNTQGAASRRLKLPPQRRIKYQPLDAEKEGLLTIQLHMPAGFSIHLEKGREAKIHDLLALPRERQYFPSPPPYEDYEDYYANCLHGFPSAPKTGRTGLCDCQIVCWTPDLQHQNPEFVDGLRKWVVDEGVKNISWR
jgi:hypothetical protein